MQNIEEKVDKFVEGIKKLASLPDEEWAQVTGALWTNIEMVHSEATKIAPQEIEKKDIGNTATARELLNQTFSSIQSPQPDLELQEFLSNDEKWAVTMAPMWREMFFATHQEELRTDEKVAMLDEACKTALLDVVKEAITHKGASEHNDD